MTLQATEPAHCVFCSIVAGDTEANWEVRPNRGVSVVCFHNRLKWAPVMLLVIPTEHMSQADLWSSSALLNVTTLAVEMGNKHCGPEGFRVVSNFGRVAHQSQFHAHLHVISGTSSLEEEASQKLQEIKTIDPESTYDMTFDIGEKPFLIKIASVNTSDQRELWGSAQILNAARTALELSNKYSPDGFRLISSFDPEESTPSAESGSAGLFLLGGGQLDLYV